MFLILTFTHSVNTHNMVSLDWGGKVVWRTAWFIISHQNSIESTLSHRLHFSFWIHYSRIKDSTQNKQQQFWIKTMCISTKMIWETTLNFHNSRCRPSQSIFPLSRIFRWLSDPMERSSKTNWSSRLYIPTVRTIEGLSVEDFNPETNETLERWVEF